MDRVAPSKRSEIMSRVRSKDTGPEMVVRRLVHSLGYRYRLHSKKLPGKPDLTFTGKKKVIFVHGCFWHYHEDCKIAHLPKSNLDIWKPKLEGNKCRDLRNQKELLELGWEFIVIWECELNNIEMISKRIRMFLSDPPKGSIEG